MAGAVAQGGARHVHRRVAHADDGHGVTQFVAFWIRQIVQAEHHVAQALALQAEGARQFRPGADEDAGVAVAQKLVDHQHRADRRVGADGDAQFLHARLVAVQKALGQTEFGDPVLQQPADLALPLKHRHRIAGLCQLDGNRHPRRPAADDSGLLVLFLRTFDHHAVEVHVRDILLNAGKVHRRLLDAADAVAGALLFVVAYDGADRGQWVGLKQDLSRLHQAVFLEELDHVRDRGVNRAALLAARVLAVQAAVCLSDDMKGHGCILLLRFILVFLHLTVYCYVLSRSTSVGAKTRCRRAGFCSRGASM